MSKNGRIRLFIGLCMLISIFIPWSIDAREMHLPTGIVFLHSLIEFIDRIGADSLAYNPNMVFEYLMVYLPFLVIPILSILSFILFQSKNRRYLLIYRCTLFITTACPILRLFKISVPGEFIGFWASTFIIIGATIIEIFIFFESKKTPQVEDI